MGSYELRNILYIHTKEIKLHGGEWNRYRDLASAQVAPLCTDPQSLHAPATSGHISISISNAIKLSYRHDLLIIRVKRHYDQPIQIVYLGPTVVQHLPPEGWSDKELIVNTRRGFRRAKHDILTVDARVVRGCRLDLSQ
jgi:hypothetical protein